MKEKIYQAGDITLRILKSNPPQLMISAEGTASSLGFTNPQLIKVKNSPNDGIYEFDFVATPPSKTAAQVLSPIAAFFVLSPMPDDFRGVKINARNNSSEKSMVVQPIFEAAPQTFEPYLETLIGARIDGDKLVLQVPTGGCTDKTSLKVNVIKGFTGIPPYIIEVYRIVPDYCEGYFPEGVEIEYALKELEIETMAQFTFVNKFGKSNR
jgi:hypothetical protein